MAFRVLAQPSCTVGTPCCGTTLTPPSWQSWTPASGRWRGCRPLLSSAASCLLDRICSLFTPRRPQPIHTSYRSECSNCEVGEQCGVLMHGRAATFCEPFGERELVSAAVPPHRFALYDPSAAQTAATSTTNCSGEAATTPSHLMFKHTTLHSLCCGPPLGSFTFSHTNTTMFRIELRSFKLAWLVNLFKGPISETFHIFVSFPFFIPKNASGCLENRTFSPVFTVTCCKADALCLEFHLLRFHYH